MAKRKWNWKHRVRFNKSMTEPELSKLIGWCNSSIGWHETLWDISKLKRRSKSTGFVSYSSIIFFFKREEDATLFKLTNLYE